MKNHVSVVVLSYNGENYVKEGFFENIISNSFLENYKTSFIALDNNSRDTTVDLIKKMHPEIDLVTSYYNTGYGKGINIVLQYAFEKYKSKYFVIFDQDAKSRENYLEKLVNFMDNHPEAAFVQPLVKNLANPDELYSAGHEYVGAQKIFCKPIMTIKKTKGAHEIPSGSILGSIVNQSALKKIGLLDPRFELYYESSDWGFRFRNAGYNNYCLYDSIVYHERELKKSNPYQLYYVFRNKILLWAKHDRKKFEFCKEQYKKEIKKIKQVFSNKTFVNNNLLQMKFWALTDGLKLSDEFRKSYKEPSLEFNKFDCVVTSNRKKFLGE